MLSLERLGHKIHDLVDYGTWKPLKFGRGNGPCLYHINFADDLASVAEASLEQAGVIQNVVAQFSSSSGQKVNLSTEIIL